LTAARWTPGRGNETLVGQNRPDPTVVDVVPLVGFLKFAMTIKSFDREGVTAFESDDDIVEVIRG
jgi:hypothetical protein